MGTGVRRGTGTGTARVMEMERAGIRTVMGTGIGTAAATGAYLGNRSSNCKLLFTSSGVNEDETLIIIM
jgi:hypothetical protein